MADDFNKFNKDMSNRFVKVNIFVTIIISSDAAGRPKRETQKKRKLTNKLEVCKNDILFEKNDKSYSKLENVLGTYVTSVC